MPEFINQLGNLTVDDQYFMESPVPQGPVSVPTGNIGMVGTFQRGPLNTPVTVVNYPDLVRNFGEVDSLLTLTGTLEARGIFAQGNTNLTVVRVDSKTTPSAAASVTLKDSQATPGDVMTLTAATTGTWANALVAIVELGSITGTFKLTLQYGNETETWDNLVIQQPGTPINGAVLASSIFGIGGKSRLATATFPDPINSSLPAEGTFAFQNGTNGATAATTDYIGADTAGVKTGLFALDSADVNIVFCAGQSDTTVNEALKANQDSITQNGGTPRRAVITFPKGTQISGLSTLVSTMDTERVDAAYPWQQISEVISGTTVIVSPLGFYAGRLAQLGPQQSPGNKPIAGTLGIDPSVNIGPSELNTLATLQINAVGVKTPAGAIGIRGGFSLSKSSGSNQSYVRRMKDYINMLVFSVAGIYVDLPITEDLMRQVEQTVNNILYPMKNPNAPENQMIQDYLVNCSDTNNTDTTMQQGKLICDYAVKLLNINRFMVFRTEIGNGVVITTPQE